MNSITELADAIAERLAPLGLHVDGPPGIQGGIRAEEADDGTIYLDGEQVEEPTLELLADKLKKDEAYACIHMQFAINKLAWTDRILNPKAHIDPEMYDSFPDLTSSEILKRDIASRIAEGQDPASAMKDALNDFIGDSDDDQD